MHVVSYSPLQLSSFCLLPLFGSSIPAGFPSPADDFIEKTLDLNELLVTHPAATFFVRVSGESIGDVTIQSGDILIVDRALTPRINALAIIVAEGELKVERIRQLESVEVWGIVTSVIHQV